MGYSELVIGGRMIDESTVMDVDVGGQGDKMDGVAEKKPFVQVRIAGFFTLFLGWFGSLDFYPFLTFFVEVVWIAILAVVFVALVSLAVILNSPAQGLDVFTLTRIFCWLCLTEYKSLQLRVPRWARQWWCQAKPRKAMDVVGRSLQGAKIIHCLKVDCPRRIFFLFLLFSQFGLIIS